VVESLVEENVQAGINGAVGVRKEVKTSLHVPDRKQRGISVSEKVAQQMHDMAWQPTECKRQHDNNEHA